MTIKTQFLKIDREVESDVHRKPNDELDHILPLKRKINELIHMSVAYVSN